jgi:hypothetical protein
VLYLQINFPFKYSSVWKPPMPSCFSWYLTLLARGRQIHRFQPSLFHSKLQDGLTVSLTYIHIYNDFCLIKSKLLFHAHLLTCFFCFATQIIRDFLHMWRNISLLQAARTRGQFLAFFHWKLEFLHNSVGIKLEFLFIRAGHYLVISKEK